MKNTNSIWQEVHHGQHDPGLEKVLHDQGSERNITTLTLGLFIPMPKAVVQHSTLISPLVHFF